MLALDRDQDQRRAPVNFKVVMPLTVLLVALFGVSGQKRPINLLSTSNQLRLLRKPAYRTHCQKKKAATTIRVIARWLPLVA